MAQPEALRQALARVEPVIADVERYVQSTLEPYCRDHKYVFVDRRKTTDSLAEKLDSGRIKSWGRLDDLYACTIVVPVREVHESAVLKKLDSTFRRARVRSRSDAKKAPDVFRFDGVRWYGRLSEDAAASRQAAVGHQLFEVQVVTAFEYAWLVVTHDLVYKADNVNWRRQRLAAQLKAAVEQIEVLIAAFDSASDAIQESPWPEAKAKTEILDQCQMLAAEGLIPETLVPESWRRFADNVYGLVESYEVDRHKIDAAVTQLLGVMNSDLRGAEPIRLPLSGSLFQYVVSIVARADTAGSLDEFCVVPSQELTDFYGDPALPRAFVFDGPSAEPVKAALPEDEVIELPEPSSRPIAEEDDPDDEA